ncbi:twin-arginine translocase subunit TatC [Derxia gummosa]|uniref:Sec-independent protein translocase protein TatC n=1 Tax=Derxia gummosa DSM 723 TaxID=1121388 RepID=A0A8B6X5K2_9BURK|nr:twin-arginine translocase subunit TatC [Derxia gummosa]
MTDQQQAPEESFISHLIELRARLVRAAIAVIAVTLALTPFMQQIFDLLSAPLLAALPTGSKLLATGVIAPFVVPLKVVLLVGFVIALPYVLYQAWAFVAPGLYQHEKRFALPILTSSFALFLLGMAFCYFFVFGVVFKAVAGFAPASVQVAPDIDAYFSFVLGMFLAFGATFEVPIVVVVLVRFGLVSVAKLKEIRPYMIVGAFVVAAIVTPPDVLSQLMLAIPLILLYEAGVFVARFVAPREKPADDEVTGSDAA